MTEPSEKVNDLAKTIFQDCTIIDIMQLISWLSMAVTTSLENQKKNYENEQKSLQLDRSNEAE